MTPPFNSLPLTQHPGLQLQELEINNLKNTVAMHVEATEDLRDTIDIQKVAIADHREGSKDLRDVIKDLRGRNDDLQKRNNDLSAKNAAHVDQRNELQETKIELAELRDDHVELIDNNKREEERVEELNAKVKQQDGIINGLKRQNDAVDSKQRFTIVELTIAIKAKDEAFQTLKSEHERLQATYATTTSDHGAAMKNLSASRMALEEELQELKDELKELRDYYEGDEEANGGSEDKIKKQDEAIAELNAKVQELTGFLRDSTRQVHRWFDEAQEECDKVEKSQKEVQQRDGTIAGLKWEAHEHSETIAELEKQLAEAKKPQGVDTDSVEAVEEFMRQLEQKDTDIEELQEQVLGGVSDKTARKLANKLMVKHKKRGETLKEVKRQVKAKDDRIEDLQGNIHSLESTIHSLDSKYQHLQGEFWAKLN